MSMTDPLGHVTRFESDFKGRMTALIDALGGRTEYSYDGNGNRTKIARQDKVIMMVYDSANRMTSLTDAEGNTTRYSYVPSGCASCGAPTDSYDTITDPLGNVYSYSYDKALRVSSVTDPLGNITKYLRDAGGQMTARIDANSNGTGFERDSLKHLAKQTDANGSVIAYSYDGRGNLTHLTDPNGNITSFSYNKNDRKIKEVRPMGQVTEYTYYKNGLVQSMKDSKGQLTSYTYDKASRLVLVAYADGKKDSFSYDSAGNLTGYENENVSATIVYDELNRKTTETVNYGEIQKTLNYTYDAKGNRSSLTISDSKAITYSYDKNNRIKVISVGGKNFLFDYQGDRLVRKTYPNGILTNFTYNANSWLTKSDTSALSMPSASVEFNFDSVGNITNKTTEKGAAQFFYDSVYRLLAESGPTNQESFTYDGVGNRLSMNGEQTEWRYNKNNELTSSVFGNHTYDYNGNISTKTDASGTTWYHWDSSDRLSKVVLPDGSFTSFFYDPFGRRIGKIYETYSNSIPVTHRWIYFYENDNIAQELYFYANGMVETTLYINGLSVDNRLAMDRNGQIFYYHTDQLGSVINITDENKNMVQHYDYKSFGSAVISTDFRNDYAYTGREWDKETGLYYYRARYYDPMEGRFVSKDPIGFDGGINIYNYVGSNPVNYIDPLGLLNPAEGACIGGPNPICIGGVLIDIAATILAIEKAINICKDKDKDKQCNEALELDLKTCEALGKRDGKSAYKICESQAMARYARCLQGTSDIKPPLPPWGTK
jgi:RHS repeat-associated protein